MADSKMINYEKVSKLIGVNVNTIYSMVHKGQIPFYRLSKRLVMFNVDEIEAWMASKKVEAIHAVEPQSKRRRCNHHGCKDKEAGCTNESSEP